MNERIRELAKQAGAVFTDCHAASLLDDEIEKFAELIVAKMLQTCEEHPGWTGRMIGEEIKQDFGVEE